MATDRLCEVCHEREAIWAAQFVGEDTPSFYTLGGHIRGFKVTRVCDECKEAMTLRASAVVPALNTPPTPPAQIVQLIPGTKVKFDHAAQRWSVRPYGRREWLSLWDNAAAAICLTDRLDKFKWYDLNGRWAACVVGDAVTDIQAVVR